MDVALSGYWGFRCGCSHLFISSLSKLSVVSLNLQGIESEDVATSILTTEVLSLSTPAQLALGRQDLSSHITVDHLVDVSSIASISITYDSQALTLCGLEDGKQRVLLQGSLTSLGVIALGGIFLCQLGSQVGSGSLGSVGRGFWSLCGLSSFCGF